MVRAAPAHFLLVLVQFLFATFPVAGKMAFGGYAPLAVAVWRVLFGGLVLMLLAMRIHPRRWRLGRHLRRTFLLSLFGVSINQIFFIEGLERSTAVTAGFMMGVIPVATYGFALLAGQERLRPTRAAGLLTALVGALLLIGAGAANGSGSDPLLGNALLFCNSLSYALYLVLARPLLEEVPSLVLTAWTFVLAIPVVVLAALGTPWTPAGDALRPTLALAWILVFPTALNYFLISWALVRLPASVIAAYIYLQPALGMILAVVLLGESVMPEQIMGGVLVMAGIWLTSRRRGGGRSTEGGGLPDLREVSDPG